MELIQNVQTANRKDKLPDIEIRAFDFFTVLVNGWPLHFRRSASRQILAYLVHHRGAVVSKEALVDEVFNEERYDEKVEYRIHVALVSLKEDLKRAGIDHILYVNNNEYAVLPSAFRCDYYEFLERGTFSIKDDPSNYMKDYDWALPRRLMLEDYYQNGTDKNLHL